jgi:Domain of unknown function (DUF4276)
LLVHVEGETEEGFVNKILSEYLVERGYETVSARIIGNARQRSRRGGIRPWLAVRKDIVRHLKEDQGCVSTTMVDYYGLPSSGDRSWPGRAEAAILPLSKKPLAVEQALMDDIKLGVGDDLTFNRFVPFVVMHEFEGLLFSDCAAFARGVGRPGIEAALQAIRDDFNTPQEINDSPDTAPSKRVGILVPGYQKPLLGVQAVTKIGLEKIREACPHFRAWLDRLESLGTPGLAGSR